MTRKQGLLRCGIAFGFIGTMFLNCSDSFHSKSVDNKVGPDEISTLIDTPAAPSNNIDPTNPSQTVTPIASNKSLVAIEPATADASIAGNKIFDTASGFSMTSMVPSTNDLLPTGVTYSDTIPATLDLAQIASDYIPGLVRTANPHMFFAPTAATLNSDFSYGSTKGPALIVSTWGSPNWGEVMLAFAQAREMTAYDRDNKENSVHTQYHMLKNMLDGKVDLAFQSGIVIPSDTPAGMTYGMQALLKHWEQYPSPNMRSAVDLFVRMHKAKLKKFSDGKRSYNAFYADMTPFNPDPGIGVKGAHYVPFTQGTALVGFSEIKSVLKNSDADEMAKDFTDFLLGYQASALWTSPDLGQYNFITAQGFAGHMYSWLEAVRGILMYAANVQAANPSSASVYAGFGNQIYQFVKNRTNAGYVGNFGSCGTTASMVHIGILLSELGAGNFYDEVDGWTRNQLAECQIDSEKAGYIPNYNSSDWASDHVGQKVKGLFFADATHVRSIPPKAQAFTTDDHAMTFRGIYEVWKKTAVFKGDSGYINFHLNRATPYLDIKSEDPYRGRVEIRTKSSIGALKKLFVRRPFGAKASDVKFYRKNSTGGLLAQANLSDRGPYGDYFEISSIEPNQTYVMTYPMNVWSPRVYQMRSDDSIWFEGSFPAPSTPEVVRSWASVFRGTTLVKISSVDALVGIPRFNQAWRAGLSNLGPDGIDAPQVSRERFVTSSCRITQSTCLNHPDPVYVGTFADNYKGAATNEETCLNRALEYYQWCGMTKDETSTALFMSSGQILRSRTVSAE